MYLVLLHSGTWYIIEALRFEKKNGSDVYSSADHNALRRPHRYCECMARMCTGRPKQRRFVPKEQCICVVACVAVEFRLATFAMAGSWITNANVSKTVGEL